MSILDMVQKDSGYIYRKVTGQEWAGACPFCRSGDDRFHLWTDKGRYWCRQCDRKGDAIQFLRDYKNLSFARAKEMLVMNDIYDMKHTVDTIDTIDTIARTVSNNGTSKPSQSTDWRSRALSIVKQAYTLLGEDAGVPGRVYLLSRGLQPVTWDDYRLGYTEHAPLPGTRGKQTAPAIVVPWYKGALITGVRYRFLDKQQAEGREIKVTSAAGSHFSNRHGIYLYGTQALDWHEDRSAQTVVLVEGELNASSIHQATGWHVFSYGSESATRLSEGQIALLGQYQRRIVWADKEKVALALHQQLPQSLPLKSPHGLDANDLLQRGILHEVLTRIITH